MTAKEVGFKSCMANDIGRYIAYKRSLARSYHTEEGALHLLDRYLSSEGLTDISLISPSAVDKFLASRQRSRPRSYNHLLGVTRQFFKWLVDQGTLCHSPVSARPKRVTSYRIPFIFDATQAKKLLEIAGQLPDNSRAVFRGETYRMIFALLYGLGLRVGEVSRLRRKDVDLDRSILSILQTKFQKSRLVPFGPRMAQRLSQYIHYRQHHGYILHPDDPLFSFGGSEAINPCTISQVFHHLLPQLKLNVPNGVAPPRLHDLRHSFAVGTLLRWYRTGMDPYQKLIYLSTFLGHVDPASTAVYLTITADLLNEASQRFERFAAPAIKEVL